MMGTNGRAFVPAWWLFNRHLQTIYPALVKRHVSIEVEHERVELADGDFIDLVWTGEVGRPVALLLHGLCGSVEASYAKGMMKTLADHGWRVVFMHFRGCSEEPNRYWRSYHSGATEDVKEIISLLQQRAPEQPMVAIGYSLGGNVLLKLLGEYGTSAPLQAAIAVSVPFDLPKAIAYMQQGSARVYQWWLLRHLRKKIQDKAAQLVPPAHFGELTKLRSFPAFDDAVTAPLHGFKDAQDYYLRASSLPYLRNITVPTLIVHAQDDPMLPQESIPTPEQLSEHVELELCENGGHVGFISGTIPGRPQFWLEQRVLDYLHNALTGHGHTCVDDRWSDL